MALNLFFREAGAGPGVVCLHASASTSGQWSGLMDRLAPSYRVIAPDSYDAGYGPRWWSDRVIGLRDEAAVIEPALAQAGSPFALVGHSYGASVALIAALANPGRVAAMVLYEPTLFSLLDAEQPAPNDADGMRQELARCSAALDAHRPEAAARCFVDFWAGAGAWDAVPATRKPHLVASVRNIRRWGHALFSEPTPLDAFRALNMPILYMVGEHSPLPARSVARVLAPVLSRVEVVELKGLGHMAPVTHPEIVNRATERFLKRVFKRPVADRVVTGAVAPHLVKGSTCKQQPHRSTKAM
jgi:pimeloyl-ACP methyl ester carboxylesterase